MRPAPERLRLLGLLIVGLASSHALAEENEDGAAAAEKEPDSQAAEAEPAAARAATLPAPTAGTPGEPPVAKDAAAKPKVGDIATRGYFRGGFGASNQKGRMTCFQLALEGGLLSKYRLGNECEVWAEFELSTVVYAGDDGSVAHVHFMPTAFIPTTYIGYSPTGVTASDLGSPGTGAAVAFPNLYADIQGIPWLAGGTAWAGTRYYKRESIYISDFFYWNPSGVGAGIEDIQVGRDLRLSYAAFAVDGQPSGSPQLPLQIDLGVRNDLQLRGIRPYRSGELQIGVQYIADFSNDLDANGKPVTHGGWGVTLRHVQELLGGDNKLVFQYGRGGGTGFGTLSRFYYPDFSLRWDPKEWRLRVLDVLTVQPTAWLGSQVAFVFQRDDRGTGEIGAVTDWYSAGARVGFALTEHAKLLGEAGYDLVKKSNGADPQYLAKFTVAPAITAGKGFMTRPELRLFYTWAMWSEAARGATVDSGRLYTDTELLSGSTFGLQGEAWW